MLWAYDFNLAFDEDFNRERFFGAHVFGQDAEGSGRKDFASGWSRG
jgi:hypothetical protein